MEEQSLSENLAESFSNLTDFFQNIALLVRDCDRLMGENDYEPVNGRSSVIYDTSYSLDNPNAWIPSYANRGYVSSKSPENDEKRVKFIGVFFRYGKGGTNDIEIKNNIPLIVAGVLLPEERKKIKYEGWVVKSWFYANKEQIIDPSNANGTIFEFSGDVLRKWNNNIHKVKTFAYPLDEMGTTNDLKEIVVQKLMDIE